MGVLGWAVGLAVGLMVGVLGLVVGWAVGVLGGAVGLTIGWTVGVFLGGAVVGGGVSKLTLGVRVVGLDGEGCEVGRLVMVFFLRDGAAVVVVGLVAGDGAMVGVVVVGVMVGATVGVFFFLGGGVGALVSTAVSSGVGAGVGLLLTGLRVGRSVRCRFGLEVMPLSPLLPLGLGVGAPLTPPDLLLPPLGVGLAVLSLPKCVFPKTILILVTPPFLLWWLWLPFPPPSMFF